MKIVIAASRRWGIGTKLYRAAVLDRNNQPLFATSRGYPTAAEAHAAVKQLRHPSMGVSSARVVDPEGFKIH